MSKRTDIRSILVLGAGPIVIGQACEFDYAGAQACKALKAEGYRVVLVNSNPATIMTDPEFADRTYIEPVTWEACERILARERPDALLPTVGGQTGLNTAVALAERGILKRLGVELIGADLAAIRKAEDRALFKAAMLRLGLKVPRSATVIESPVCTPMGSKFSIEQITTQLSARSRMTSSSYSFQPAMERSIRISEMGLAARPVPAMRTKPVSSWAIPVPAPPRMNDGRTITG